MSKRFLLTLLTLIAIGLGALGAFFFVKGYTFSPEIGKVVGTGIISVTSVPDGASVYLDGHLVTATNANISQLEPKEYQVKVLKESFIPWEKKVKVSKGMVEELKISLFPAIPTIYPLTFNGVVAPAISSDGGKLAFTVPLTEDPQAKQKGGVWVWTMSSQPISFNRGGQPQQIVASGPSFDFSKASLKWSPDSKQLLVSIQQGGLEGKAYERNFLVPIDQNTSISNLRDTTPTLTSLMNEWQEDQKIKDRAALLSITDLSVKKIASEAGNLVDNNQKLKWSPDESKFMVVKGAATKGTTGGGEDKLHNTAKVYSLSTEKPASYDLPQALDYHWLPNSRHIILVQKDKIEISEFDGGNVATIYAGSFDPLFIFPWPDSSRIVVLSSHPTPTASTPNLFGINLK